MAWFVVVGKMTDSDIAWQTRVEADNGFAAIEAAVYGIEPDSRDYFEITGAVNTETCEFTAPCDNGNVCMACDYPVDDDDDDDDDDCEENE